MKLRTLVAAVTLALGASLPAHAIIVTDNNNATDLVNAIIGTGITVQGTPTLTFNTDKPAGTFTGGAGSVGFDSGIVLTTGTTDSSRARTVRVAVRAAERPRHSSLTSLPLRTKYFFSMCLGQRNTTRSSTLVLTTPFNSC